MDVSLAIELKPMGIPYLRPDDGTSHSYIDLRRQPEMVRAIPEVRALPVLGQVITDLNGPESSFRTLGCGCYLYTEDVPPNLQRCVAYLGFCFADFLACQQAGRFYSLFHAFCESVPLGQNTDPVVRFELRRTMFYAEDIMGWSLDYFMLGRGGDSVQALQGPVESALLLTKFLLGWGGNEAH